MNNLSITIPELYPEHLQIPILDPKDCSNDLKASLTSVNTIDLICQVSLQAYLQNSLGLNVAVAYPTDLKFTPLISQLVTGFVLTVATIRIAFIPSEESDYSGFEIEQEWVDLSNWVADYYVPIQVDLESKLLHLWGFISHRDVKEQGEFDRIARTYIIDRQYLSDDLEDLWLMCELLASGEMSPEQGEIPVLPELLPHTAQVTIEALRQHDSIFSPRLSLSFAQWGGILNQPKYLELYLDPAPLKMITRLSDWFERKSVAIYEDWKSIELFLQPAQSVPAFRSSFNNLQPRLAPTHFRGVPLNTAAQIDREIRQLYASSDLSLFQISANISEPVESLVHFIQHTGDDNLRFQALEYLWTIDPDHSLVQSRRIKDLGMIVKDHPIGLMIAALGKQADRVNILARIYPLGIEAFLPPNLQLWLLDEHGNLATSQPIVSRSNPFDSYIQLNFTADRGDLFSIAVKLDDSNLTESFLV
jgi:Protein of unknown function (DUF1822)